MTITDPALAARLAAMTTPQELLDADGHLLGRHVPTVPGMRFPELGITDAEIATILADPFGWVPVTEVDARLRALRSHA